MSLQRLHLIRRPQAWRLVPHAWYLALGAWCPRTQLPGPKAQIPRPQTIKPRKDWSPTEVNKSPRHAVVVFVVLQLLSSRCCRCARMCWLHRSSLGCVFVAGRVVAFVGRLGCLWLWWSSPYCRCCCGFGGLRWSMGLVLWRWLLSCCCGGPLHASLLAMCVGGSEP